MKSRKRVWIAVLCLLSATLFTIGLRLRVNRVQAATPAPRGTSVLSRGPVAPFASASLPAAAMRNAAFFDDADPTRVTGNGRARVVFPPVEQFTLTPPNPALGTNKTMLEVHFAGAGAAQLPVQIHMTLGTQHVLVQRSGEDPNAYLAAINFDWQTFAQEQEQRKQAAANGKMVSIFSGRKFIRTEPMQFMDPAQIQQALQTHQSIQLTPDMLLGGTTPVVPDHQLLIENIQVVEDPTRTFDQCLPSTSPQNQNGAWTFNTLMQAIACSSGGNNCTQGAAENMLLSMLANWQKQQTINSFQIQPRPNIGTLDPNGTKFLSNWPIDQNNFCSVNGQPSSCPSLPNAPVHLLAIVNRIDLGQNNPNFPPAGELRFVFGVTAGIATDQTPVPCAGEGNQSFTIILEYNVPISFTAQTWANVWGALPTTGFGTAYRSDLQTTITDKVVTADACTAPSGAAISCIAQIRTNEIELGAPWEQRQFQLATTSTGQPVLNEGTISMTPDGKFNHGQPMCNPCDDNGFVVSWINDNQNAILNSDGALPPVPLVWQNNNVTEPFLGGSAFNNALTSWVDQTQTISEPARIDFSFNTCNGCHGGETHTVFLQVQNRAAGTQTGDQPSVLSNFLLGCVPTSVLGCGNAAGPDTCGVGTTAQCLLNTPGQETVPDPNTMAPPPQIDTLFGDILRRQMILSNLITDAPGSGGMLMPFLAQPVGVH